MVQQMQNMTVSAPTQACVILVGNKGHKQCYLRLEDEILGNRFFRKSMMVTHLNMILEK